MIPGAVHRSPGIYLTAEEKNRKTSAKKPSMKAVQPIIAQMQLDVMSRQAGRLTCCPWSHGLRPKKLSVSVVVPLAPVRVPSQIPLAPSVVSVTSVANDKGDN